MRYARFVLHTGLLITALGFCASLAGCKSACRPGMSLKDGICVSTATTANGAQAVAAGTAAPPSTDAAGTGAATTPGKPPETEGAGAAASSMMSVSTAAAKPAASGTAGASSSGDASNSSSKTAGASDAGAGPATAPSMPDGPCAGHGDESFCDDATMHHCAASAEAGPAEKCMSAALCQVGATSGACAVCVPGTFQCEGVMLNQCTDAGQYMPAMECASADLCKEDAGACLDMQCMPNSVTCSSDGKTLKTCNADGSEFASEEPCGAPGCNQTLKQCNVCMPGAKSCSGNSLTTCSTDGQGMMEMECAARGGECATSMCRNNACVAGVMTVGTACSAGKCDATGKCVECITGADCPDPGPCNTKTCSLGKCGMQPKASGTTCPGDGMICDGRGGCMHKPCGNGVLDPGEACDPNPTTDPQRFCTASCKWRNAQYAACSFANGTSCPVNSGQGWFCGPNGACSHSCSESSDCKTETGYGNCIAFGNSGLNCAISCGSCPNGLKCVSWGGMNICGQINQDGTVP
jgi:hypothetical protein